MSNPIRNVADLPKCLGPCKRPIRPSKSVRTEWPGTVAMGHAGVCANCRAREREALKRAAPAPIVRKAKDYGVPVTLPRVPSAAEVAAARRRHHKPRIGRWVLAGRAYWWVLLPGVGTHYAGGWRRAVGIAQIYGAGHRG